MRLWLPVGTRRKSRETVFKNENIISEPRTIAITSGKGGVGKTSITVNLAPVSYTHLDVYKRQSLGLYS